MRIALHDIQIIKIESRAQENRGVIREVRSHLGDEALEVILDILTTGSSSSERGSCSLLEEDGGEQRGGRYGGRSSPGRSALEVWLGPREGGTQGDTEGGVLSKMGASSGSCSGLGGVGSWGSGSGGGGGCAVGSGMKVVVGSGYVHEWMA